MSEHKWAAHIRANKSSPVRDTQALTSVIEMGRLPALALTFTRRFRMKKIMLSLIAVLCLPGLSALSFASEIGKLKADLKGEQDMIKTDIKGEQDKVKADMKAQQDKKTSEMMAQKNKTTQKGEAMKAKGEGMKEEVKGMSHEMKGMGDEMKGMAGK